MNVWFDSTPVLLAGIFTQNNTIEPRQAYPLYKAVYVSNKHYNDFSNHNHSLISPPLSGLKMLSNNWHCGPLVPDGHLHKYIPMRNVYEMRET